MSDSERGTLSIKTQKKLSRKDLAKFDIESLAGDDKFLRTVFTILDTAGMFTGNYHSDGRNHAFLEGRRSLGLDILRTVEEALGPDALSRILEAENKTQQGGSSAHRRSGTDYADDRGDELGGPDVQLERAGSGLQYLNYGSGED